MFIVDASTSLGSASISTTFDFLAFEVDFLSFRGNFFLFPSFLTNSFY